MTTKDTGGSAVRTIPQAVFDSPEAIRAAKAGHAEACRQLADTPRHLLDEGNPNHPRYDLRLFGVPADEFMARQYRATPAVAPEVTPGLAARKEES